MRASFVPRFLDIIAFHSPGARAGYGVVRPQRTFNALLLVSPRVRMRGCPGAAREPERRRVSSRLAGRLADRSSRRIVRTGRPYDPARGTIQVTRFSRSSFRPVANIALDEVQSGRSRSGDVNLRYQGESLKVLLLRHERCLTDQLSPTPGMQVL